MTGIIATASTSTESTATGTTAPSLQEIVARFYRQYREDVFGYLVSRGVSPPEARATCLDSFHGLFQALARGEKISNRRAWVFAAAHNAVTVPGVHGRSRGAILPRQSHSLHLRTVGFRYREIAEITGVTLATLGESLVGDRADDRHPSAGELLQYLDRELPRRKYEATRGHAGACWRCQTHLDGLRRNIAENRSQQAWAVWREALRQEPWPELPIRIGARPDSRANARCLTAAAG